MSSSCVDGLKVSEAIDGKSYKRKSNPVLFYMVRHSAELCRLQRVKEVAGAIYRKIACAASRDEASYKARVCRRADAKYPAVSQAVTGTACAVSHYPKISPCVIHTTNVESVNMSPRKIIKNRGSSAD